MWAFWFLSDFWFWAGLVFLPTTVLLPPVEPGKFAAALEVADVAAAAVVEAVLVEDAVEDLRLFSKKAEAEAGSWNHSPNSSKHQPCSA